MIWRIAWATEMGSPSSSWSWPSPAPAAVVISGSSLRSLVRLSALTARPAPPRVSEVVLSSSSTPASAAVIASRLARSRSGWKPSRPNSWSSSVSLGSGGVAGGRVAVRMGGFAGCGQGRVHGRAAHRAERGENLSSPRRAGVRGSGGSRGSRLVYFFPYVCACKNRGSCYPCYPCYFRRGAMPGAALLVRFVRRLVGGSAPGDPGEATNALTGLQRERVPEDVFASLGGALVERRGGHGLVAVLVRPPLVGVEEFRPGHPGVVVPPGALVQEGADGVGGAAECGRGLLDDGR